MLYLEFDEPFEFIWNLTEVTDNGIQFGNNLTISFQQQYALNSAYNKVAFNEKSAITKENLHTNYTPFTYNDVTLNKKPPITKGNLCIFFFSL